MSTFTLITESPHYGSRKVEVNLPSNLTEQELWDFDPFTNWLNTLKESINDQSKPEHAFHQYPYSLRSINVHSVDRFGRRIGFIKMEAVVENENRRDNPLDGIVFLRGGSVAILVIIRPSRQSNERWVIMTQQPRIPAGSLNFYEIPAGMIDGEKKFVGAAARELLEETGLRIEEHELIDMTELALENSTGYESHLQKAMYPSPGGCDEFIPLFLCQKFMSITEMNDLRDKLTGVGREKITVKLVKYEELWREGARDAKTLAAWALYEGLIQSKKITRDGRVNRKSSAVVT